MHQKLASALLTGLAVAFASTGPAAAQESCFENLGRTGCPSRETFPDRDLRRLSCENLWLVRNSIFKARGYCFATDRAIATFGNDGCRYPDQNQVPLNTHERNNVQAIRRVESAKGC